jgi:beta-galactosidase/beta-glucuronidase
MSSSTAAIVPRPEHPRPQFQRDAWINLNGTWTYAFDFGQSGQDAGRRLDRSTGFPDKITVPFCPESALSGVAYKDFIPAMWYHRSLEIPAAWQGSRILLHFGAVDYECEAYLDGVSVGTHFGGAVSFTLDVTRQAKPGTTQHLVVRAKDDVRSGHQPGGKQAQEFKSHGCHYTRTTGIWQTVWIEAVNPFALKDIYLVSDLDGGSFVIQPRYHAEKSGLRLVATLKDGGKAVAQASVPAVGGVPAILSIPKPKPWSPESPFLYDLDLQVVDPAGAILDQVASYAGLRKIHIEGNRVFLNNRPLYQRLVLDQGFYPDGIWTAPSDAALKQDIELSMKAGFNGARLHQKVFEERFHHWADRLGYLTWGETPSWGCDANTVETARNFLAEWAEILVRDRNHPSIIAWTPWNETCHRSHPRQHARVHRDSYALCKNLDPTRPVNDASGYIHCQTDLWTVHNYEQDPKKLADMLTPHPEKGVWRNFPDQEVDYDGQPYLVDEYGGIQWIPSKDRVFADNSWGYGEAPKTLDELYARLQGQTDALLGHPHICGYCYTQLTDVEQEQNGIYNYDRTEKFDMAVIRNIFGRNP